MNGKAVLADTTKSHQCISKIDSSIVNLDTNLAFIGVGIGISMTSRTDGEPALVITNLRGMSTLGNAINQCLHANCRANLGIIYPAFDVTTGVLMFGLLQGLDEHLVYPHMLLPQSLKHFSSHR